MTDLLRRLIGFVPEWLEQLILTALFAGVGALVGLAVHGVLFRVLHRLTRASASKADDILVGQIDRPSRWSFVAIGLVIGARQAEAFAGIWERISDFVMPLLVGWIAIAILRALVEVVYLKSDITVENNRDARRRRTRLTILARIIGFGIIFLTVALMLFSIPGVMKVGATLMASAGLAALAVGAAAQPALKAMIGGFQMALTEPISIDDVVVIDGEWGRIEDIRTTYVVVRVWDDRRLVVPTTKFLEDTFQNWTKTTSELIGTVFLYLDPATDIAPIREEYTRQIKAHRMFDGRAQILQVTDHNADAMEVRLLMSAKDGPVLFDLRCEIRESMIEWIRRTMPEALVRRRMLPVSPVELAATPSMADALGLDGRGAERAH